MLGDMQDEINVFFLNAHFYYDTTIKDSMVVFTR